MTSLLRRPVRPQPSTLPALNQQFEVSFRYEVHFTQGLFQAENPLLAQVLTQQTEVEAKKMLVVVDRGLLPHHPQLLNQIESYTKAYPKLVLPISPIVVPGGEAAKNNPHLIEQLHQTMDEIGLCRHSYVVAIGGGAVVDMVGYAAATAHRGIRLVRVPTTVLAQNDSGVGVKNGINAFNKKNFLGTFAPPFAVLNDFEFLTTLDDRDWRSGMAEAIKVALIKSPEFFANIEAQAEALARREMPAMQQLIYHCAQLHLDHIASHGDPFELGSSRPLDFGHWAAHRLERLTEYELRHGEAVAIGIALDATYSYLINLLPKADWQRICKMLKTLGFALFVPKLMSYLDAPEHSLSLFRGLSEFQEHLGGELTLMLLTQVGQGVEVHQVDLEQYRKAIALLSTL